MFQTFLDLLQPEGTWDKYELKPNSFSVLNDEKMQALASKGLEIPLFSGKIFPLQEYSVKAIEANLYAFNP